MLMQVKIINGQKTFVPISGTIATNTIEQGNQYPVTSNAVANIYEYGDLEPPTTGNNILHYMYNKITNVMFIYGSVNPTILNSYSGYQANLPNGFYFDSNANYFDCTCTGSGGSLVAGGIAKCGGNDGNGRQIQVRYYQEGFNYAKVAIHIKVRYAP